MAFPARAAAISRIEVECVAIHTSHLAALLEVVHGHAKRTTDGNCITEAIAACMHIASGIREDLDLIIEGGAKS